MSNAEKLLHSIMVEPVVKQELKRGCTASAPLEAFQRIEKPFAAFPVHHVEVAIRVDPEAVDLTWHDQMD